MAKLIIEGHSGAAESAVGGCQMDGAQNSKFTGPVIDLRDFEGPGRSKIRDEIAQACESFGFFQVQNHGVDPELMQKIREFSRSFFHLADEEKTEYLKTEDTLQGYATANMKIGAVKPFPSPHIFYVLSPMSKRREDLWPRNPPGFGEAIREYAKEVKVLADKVLSVLSEVLGLAPKALQEKLEGPSGEPVNTLRANYYPPCGTEDLQVCLASHSDPGGITFLQATSVGTQFKINDRWMTIEPAPNAFCVNVGDQIEILSNGRLKSVEHRGLGCRDRERLSIPFFYNPAFENVVTPLEELIDDAHPALYKAMTFGDYFFKYFYKIGVGGGKQAVLQVVHA